MTTSPNEPIAIIGIGCTFPGGATSPETLWELLITGFDGIIDTPKSRWDNRRFYSQDTSIPGKMNVKRGGFLQQPLDQFDATFFNITPREADTLDPQQRLILETSWRALEDAGICPEDLKGTSTGTFIGAFTTDWQNLNNSPYNVHLSDLYTGINASQTVLSARLAYFYDLHGPCLTVDTACSSSLVAVHLACKSIWNGESSMAIAGGVNAMIVPSTTTAMARGRFLNPEGQCRPFDADARGYVRGEGAGIVILKPLKDAIASSDTIYAVIRGSGINHDGHTNGLAMPNPEAQKALITSVLSSARIDPASVQYVEAHGTGTQAGDPAEAWALDAALKSDSREGNRCFVGSIKSNIGHLEAAAGVAGLIKAALCLKHRKIPPTIHFKTPNPNIPFDNNCLKVAETLADFSNQEKPLFVGVNSFGYGGTNAHLILEDYKESIKPYEIPVEKLYATPFSACTSAALKDFARLVAAYLQSDTKVPLAHIANTLIDHRQQFDKRIAILAKSSEELARNLHLYTENSDHPSVVHGEKLLTKPKIAFVFSGMGPQWHAMGQELYTGEPIFASTIRRCDEFLKPLTGWSLIEELSKDETSSKISAPEYAQPANFAIQAALYNLLAHYNVVAEGVVEHSIGEVAAAYAAEALTLEQGVLVSYHRSRIQAQRQDLGTMLAVELSHDESSKLIEGKFAGVSIAAVNSPTSTTLSGDHASLSAISKYLDEINTFNRLLNVNIAYHSKQMDGLEADVLNALKTLETTEPSIPHYSTVYPNQHSKNLPDAAYWWKNIREPVLFSQAIGKMGDDGFNVFIEIGPHPVLGKSIRETLLKNNISNLTLYTLNRKEREEESILRLLTKLHLAGCSGGLKSTVSVKASRVNLPGYPWQRKSHWIESEASKAYRISAQGHPMLSHPSPESPVNSWHVEVNEQFFPWLADHKLEGTTVFPGAAYVEAALAIQERSSGVKACILENIRFHQPLVISPSTEPVLCLRTSESQNGFTILSRSSLYEGNFTTHATGKFSPPWNGFTPVPLDIAAIRRICHSTVKGEEVYLHYASIGMEYGPAFQRIRTLHRGEGLALAEIGESKQPTEYILSPTLFDAALQSLLGTRTTDDRAGLAMPVGIDFLHFYATPSGPIICYAVAKTDVGDEFTGDITLCSPEGVVFVHAVGVRCRLLKNHAAESRSRLQKTLYRRVWEESSLKSDDSDSEKVLFIDTPNIEFLADTSSCKRLLAQILAREQSFPGSPYTLWIVTHEVERVLNSDKICNVSSSMLWGLGRVIRHEYPHIDCRLLDLPKNCPDILNTIRHSPKGSEIAWRNGSYYTPKVDPITDFDALSRENSLTLNSNTNPFTLELSVPGSTGNLYFRESSRRAPERGEVEIQVNTSSLNFKDLMKVLGLLDKKALDATYFGNNFGMECSGIVTRIGKGVKSVAVGDVVCAFSPNTFSSFLTLPALSLSPLPKGSSLQNAPSFIPFITVLRGLMEIGNLKKGESILIHTATGAVGMAAVQYAKHVGAKIFATAGSPEKREYLRSQGVAYVSDSRSTQFYDEIMAWTNGRGVDVVLNALSGDALLKSWSLIARYGRFIEIGKRDISQNTPLPMEVFNRNATFASIDLDRTFCDDPTAIRRLISQALHFFERGVFTPLPAISFPASEVKEAFDYLARAKHIGKVMVSFEDCEVEAAPRWHLDPLFESDASYIITGGLSGFGLATAEWIVRQGGKHLLLVSRSGASTDVAREGIKRLKDAGAKVKLCKADVADFDTLKGTLGKCLKNAPPVRGIFHAAMVLDDALIADLTPERFDRVVKPKALGCWNLHLLAQDHELNIALDYFVLYSSVSTLIGNPTQGNYSAANAFLDTFSQYRISQGLPSLTINWGAIGDVGVVARQGNLATHLKESGILPRPISECIDSLESLLRLPKGHTGNFASMDIDWPKLLKALPSLKEMGPFDLFNVNESGSIVSDFTSHILSLAPENSLSLLIEFIKDRVAHTLRIEAPTIDPSVKLNTLGMDSLMAMELQHQMEQKLACKIPTMELIKGPSINDLSGIVLKILNTGNCP